MLILAYCLDIEILILVVMTDSDARPFVSRLAKKLLKSQLIVSIKLTIFLRNNNLLVPMFLLTILVSNPPVLFHMNLNLYPLHSIYLVFFNDSPFWIVFYIPSVK